MYQYISWQFSKVSISKTEPRRANLRPFLTPFTKPHTLHVHYNWINKIQFGGHWGRGCSITISNYDQKLWSAIMISNYNQQLPSAIAISKIPISKIKFSKITLSKITISNCYQQLRPAIGISNCDQQLRPSIAISDYYQQLQSIITFTFKYLRL